MMIAAILGVAIPFAKAAGETEPVSRELTAQYFVNALDIKNQMLNDYRKLIQVYYQYKNKKPEAAKNATFPEFSSAQYNEFAAELDADPRLQNNAYRDFMRSYGGSGADNDVMQRLYQHFDKNFAHLSPAQLDELHLKINRPMAALALTESKEIFADLSLAAGYPGNRQHSIELQLKNYRLEIAEISMRFRSEISKARAAISAPCAPDFAKIKPSAKR